MSYRRANLKGSIGRVSRSFRRETARSRRRRKNQRTDGNKKWDAKVTAAKSSIRIKNHSGISTVDVMPVCFNFLTLGKPFCSDERTNSHHRAVFREPDTTWIEHQSRQNRVKYQFALHRSKF
ncbi:MAG: hypothetical protein ABJQ70_08070 [Roseobacter sp.]